MIIIGLDGTLRNNAWRLPLIESEGWDAYHEQARHDAPHDAIAMLCKMAKSKDRVVCLTAAPERWRMLTMEWLVCHSIPIDQMLMRPPNDWKPEPELKMEMLRALGSQTHEPVHFVVDDNEKVCDVYRASGLDVLQFFPTNGGA